MTTGAVRSGPLSEAALVDAVAAEVAAGARPTRLVVSGDLELLALRILSSPTSALSRLQASAPNVAVDVDLPVASWRLE